MLLAAAGADGGGADRGADAAAERAVKAVRDHVRDERRGAALDSGGHARDRPGRAGTRHGGARPAIHHGGPPAARHV